jgi:hypothetical protein
LKIDFAGLKSISDEVEELHTRELDFHLDHQKRYERLRGMIAGMETRYFREEKRRLQKKLKQRERGLNAGKRRAGEVPKEPASTPPQNSEPESRRLLLSAFPPSIRLLILG